jgi:hypothetical protein
VKYLSGTVSLGLFGERRVVCFRNTRDDKAENAPDWIIYLSQPRPQNGGSNEPITDDKEDLPF